MGWVFSLFGGGGGRVSHLVVAVGLLRIIRVVFGEPLGVLGKVVKVSRLRVSLNLGGRNAPASHTPPHATQLGPKVRS